MMAVSSPVQARSETRIFRVEELVAHARAGRIRVPTFQRAFQWDRSDVQKLLDSVWRGYPIGTLLLWSKAGPAGRVTLGELELEVGEQHAAWFVVDGQQRLVSLVSTLLAQGRRGESFDLYFDLRASEIVRPGRTGAQPTDLPLDRVLDSERLLAWVDDHRAALSPDEVRLAFRVGKAMREYEVPAYVVDVDDIRVVQEIFSRTNSTGKALAANDVFHALHTSTERAPTVSLRDFVERLRARSFGELEEHEVQRSLLAIAGKDPSTDPLPQLAGIHEGAVVERAERAIERALAFLVQDAGIPHPRLMPHRGALTSLAAYFDRFATPSSRARRLLTRWLWRGSVAGESTVAGHSMRLALSAIRSASEDEAAAQGVLGSIANRRPVDAPSESFDLRVARSRLSLLALIELRPYGLRTAEPVDVPSLLASTQEVALQIFADGSATIEAPAEALYASVGNRIIHPDHPDGRSAISAVIAAISTSSQPPKDREPSASVLASHAITLEAIAQLRAGDRLGFLRIRRDVIERATALLIDRHAEWEHSDRVSLASLISGDD